MKLFCFPYAGGSSVVFNNWKSYLRYDIELRAIELAGRGKRIMEAHYTDLNDAVNDVFSLIISEIRGGDSYAFFGHSMGAKIVYELTQRIMEKRLPGPKHIFFSGRGAPNISRFDEKAYHKLPDEEFKKEILKLGGTPKEFFEHPELVDVFLPLLKNDFRLAHEETPIKEINPFPCDITVFMGKDEDLTPEQVDGWKNNTSGICTIHYFNGGHFFINEKAEEVIKRINSTLQQTSKPVKLQTNC
ncbi:MAG: thioesterase [Bacteroidales bacterium]|nr:thioesterase [Bacteroidales bacterium]